MINLTFLSRDSSTAFKRTKRNAESKKLLKKRKIPDRKLPKLKKIDPKELVSIIRAEQNKLKLKDPKDLKRKSSSVFTAPYKKPMTESKRPKRKDTSSCSYTYESCDPSRRTGKGCPLCYRCKCEPTDEVVSQKFSTKDIRIPYRIADRDEQFVAAAQQEFDVEPSSYTGLNDPNMYKQYIQEIISKYPEHMSRTMPNIKDRGRDLMKFISQLAQNDESPRDMEPQEIRYRVIDNAMDLYKYYERAISKKPKFGRDGKILKSKRGTVLEVIEMNSDEIKDAGLKISNDDF